MGDMAGGKIGKDPLKSEGVAHCRRWARFVHHYYFFNAAVSNTDPLADRFYDPFGSLSGQERPLLCKNTCLPQ